MKKYLVITIIMSLILGCSPENQSQNNTTDKSENKSASKIVYAYSYRWSFDMKLIPIHKFDNSQIKNANILKIEYLNNKPKRVTWLYSGETIPMMQMGKEVYSIEFKYNEKIMTQSFLDKNKNLTNDMYGISKIVTKFDNEGNKILQSFFNSNNQNVKDEYGNLKYSYLKGKSENERISYALDINDKQIEFAEGGFEIDYILDKNGVIIENIWKDDNENIYLNKNGYAISKLKYDNKYQLVELRYFDTNKSLILHNQNNFAYYTNKYDVYGNKIETSYFNVNSELTNNTQSECAIIKADWSNGRPIKFERIDDKGKVIY